MTAPNTDSTGSSTAPVASAADEGLSDDWGSLLADDFSPDAAASAETPQSDTGTPPAATGETPAPTDTAPSAEHAETPAVAATEATEPQPDWTPFTYTVNGETRTAEGFYRTPDGVVVDPEKADWLMQRLSERDHYYAKDQESSQHQQQLTEALTKLTSWNVAGPNGTTQTLVGADGIEAQRVQLGRALAENQALHAALRDPQQLAQLVAAQQAQDGTWYIVPNEQGLKTLGILLDRDGMRVEQMARHAMSQLRAGLQTFRAGPTPGAQSTVQAPNEQQIVQTIKNAAAELGVSNLTPQDEAFLARQMPRYIRDATEAERPRFGARVLDGDFRLVVQNIASQRAAIAKTAAVASTAGQQNAAAIRAANVGKRAPTPSPTATNGNAPPAPTTQDEAWDRHERAARAALTRRAM